MSPIGRVFIVLNLVFAGGFLAFAGTHLQKQHHYKVLYEQEKDGRTKDVDRLTVEKDNIEKDRNTFENAKTSAETQLGAANNSIAKLQDDNKRLAAKNDSFEADLKAMLAIAEASKTQSKAAWDQANAAFAQATEQQKVKDEAVNAKNAAEAENRELKNTIASLNETATKRDLDIAALKKDQSELRMLVKVAETNGFLRSMAAPNLSGRVTNASGRLATLIVTENPGNIDIAQAIESGNISFAIYDAKTGYKAEAVAERYDASANAVFCKINSVKGDVREGDLAATKTP